MPTPFKKGNFVRINVPKGVRYGIIEITPTPASFPYALCRNDMRIPVTFFEEKGDVKANSEQVDYLSLELVPDDELTERYDYMKPIRLAVIDYKKHISYIKNVNLYKNPLQKNRIML